MCDQKAQSVRWFEEVWNQQRVESIDELFAPSGLCYGLGTSGAPLMGPEEFKPFHRMFLGAFPDLKIEVEMVLGEGEMTVVRFTATGTHLGDTLGFSATGRTMHITGMSMIRWENNQIAEGWNNFDQFNMFLQLGDPLGMAAEGTVQLR